MSDIKNYLNNFIDEIKLLIDNKTKKLDYDKTYRGIVKSINDDICEVEINNEIFSCKIRNDLQIDINDIVLIKSINNNFSDKFVDAKLGVIGDGVSEGVDWANVIGKPMEFPPSIHTQDASTITGLSDVAISGSYNDLTNQPIIPDVSTKADLIYVDTELDKKVDKIDGKKLSSEDFSALEKQKLANIQNNANNYTHPSNHSADIIVDGTTNKVFTSIEKNKLNTISEYATKTESSVVNGNVIVNNVETPVYRHPTGTNPHGTTKNDLNLGNVENKSSSTIRNEITNSNITTALGYTPESTVNKNKASGYAGLDSNAKIPLSLLPDISMNKSYVVNTIADRDALTGLNTADRVYVLDAGDGSREGFIWDGVQWLKDSDTDWANVNLEWVNISGKPISSPADIDDSISKKHTHTNKTIIDAVTQILIDNWNNAFTHISDTIKHITSVERTKWNTVDNKVDKISGKGLSTEDYSTTEKQKLAGIEMGANKYTLPVANDSVLGGIKVGNNLSITQDGVLSASSNPDNYIIKEEEFITASNQTVFTLSGGSYTPNKNMIDVYVYGQKQPKDLFVEFNSTTITSKLPFEENIRVIIKYIQGINATPYPVHGDMHLAGGDDAIPLATTLQDGLMSKDDKSKVHNHSNKTLLDTYTQTEISLADAVNKKHSHSGNDAGHYHNTDRDRGNHTGTQLASTVSDFASTVRSTVLTGLSTTTNMVISVTDSVLSALGKLQKQISDNLTTLINHIGNTLNPHGVTKSQVNLGNVDDTSDLNKPISTAVQTALDDKVANSRVLTDVPTNAKFTDTMTIINGKTGAIAKSDIVALGIPAQDTVYMHPTTHLPSIIAQDSNNRLVTDTEKTNWNSAYNNNHTHSNKSVLDAATASFTTALKSKYDTAYANSHTHSNKSSLDLVSGTNTGNETNTSIGTLIDSATTKITPIDTDMVGLMDSGASNILKKLSWANIKVTLKTYFDGLYALTGHNHTLVGLSEKSYSSLTDKPASLPANGGNANTVNGFTLGMNVPIGSKLTDTVYTHPSTHPASMIIEGTTKRFVTDIEKAKWDGYYRGNWNYVTFNIYGDADVYYPVVLTGLDMNEASMSFLEIYRAYSWKAPSTWYTSTHKGGLNLSIDYSLAGWGGQNYELQITLSQTYSKMVADIITASPDTSAIVVWLRGGDAQYQLRRQSNKVNITVYDGVQNDLPFKNKAGTQYETIYDSTTTIENWFNFTGIRKLLTTENNLYIGGGYRNPKNSVKIYHEKNKPTPSEIGASATGHVHDDRYYTETEMKTLLGGKVDNSRVLTDVPANAKFTDTNTTYSEITTAEIDAGASSTLRAITGRRIKYILDKVATMISSLTKSDVGLGNVDNTSDLNKPISTATQTALNSKVDNSRVLTNVPSGAKFTDTIYTHPSNHPASMITESTTKRFVSDTEKSSWSGKAEKSDIPTKVGQLENDSGYVTQGELGDAGFGNMMKEVYDTNNNGIVDNAEKVNGFTVGANVPANAKFTDTNTITTINGKTGAILKSDITALGIPAQDTTYNTVTTTTNGLMIATDKVKLNGIESGANKYTHPSSHPSSMIVESTTKRFVSDTEKSAWNNKTRIAISTAQPTGMSIGDVWIQEI